MSNDDAVKALREIVQQTGPITLTVAKCWEPEPVVPQFEPRSSSQIWYINTCLFGINDNYQVHVHMYMYQWRWLSILMIRTTPSEMRIPLHFAAPNLLLYQYFIQWNLSNPDTLGKEESVLISEVSWFQGLKLYTNMAFGTGKVSCLSRCPHFRESWLEAFRCI